MKNSEFDFGLMFFFGKVEDRHDPLEAGRLRVRVYGIHTPDKIKDHYKGIPTDELFWAQPINKVQSAAMNGVGQTPLGAVESSMVFGFFLDGSLAQDPFILGTIDGIPVDPADPRVGFNDPNGVYPKAAYLNEPDVNRLARSAFSSSPSLVNKIAGLISGIPTAVNSIANTGVPGSTDSLGPKWSEPAPSNSPRYPYNHVKETESGHIEEFDDTPGHERIHRSHRTGTYTEWRPDGSEASKVVGDSTLIIIGDRKFLVGGDQQITILGNAKLLVQGNVQEQINGNCTRLIKGNLVEKIEGNYSRDILGNSAENTQGNVSVRDGSNRTESTIINKTETIGANNSQTINGLSSIQVLGDWTNTAGSNYTQIVGGNMGNLVGGNCSFSVSSAYGLAAASFSVGVSGAASIDAAGPTTILGSVINLN